MTPRVLISSFRDGPKDQARNLEIPGSRHPSRLLPTWKMISPNSGTPEFDWRAPE